MMKKYGIKIIIALSLSAGIILIWYYFLDSPGQRLDDEANQQFAQKARELHIVGKTRAYILEYFGDPVYSYITTNEEADVLVYVPGPKWYFWPSECKIRIDQESGLVTHWGINSD